jgi:hypothetical protein
VKYAFGMASYMSRMIYIPSLIKILVVVLRA